MSDQTFGRAARAEWDALEREAEARRNELDRCRTDQIRMKLAEVIHNSWSVEPFDEVQHPEDLVTADAVLAAFPQMSN